LARELKVEKRGKDAERRNPSSKNVLTGSTSLNQTKKKEGNIWKAILVGRGKAGGPPLLSSAFPWGAIAEVHVSSKP